MKVLVTGAAGFIGFFTAKELLARGDEVVGLDNRQRLLRRFSSSATRLDLSSPPRRKASRTPRRDLEDRLGGGARSSPHNRFDRVVNLAAQAGVRYSLENPHAYVDSNLVVGSLNVLEGCRHNEVEPPRLRLFELRLRRQHERCPSRSTTTSTIRCQPLRRVQEGQRADGPHLFSQPLRACRRRGSASSRCTARGGGPDMALFALHEGDPGGRAHPGVQPRESCVATSPTSTTSSSGVVRVTRQRRGAECRRRGPATQPDPGDESSAPYPHLQHRQSIQPVELHRSSSGPARGVCLGSEAEKIMMPMQLGGRTRRPTRTSTPSSAKTSVSSPPPRSPSGVQRFVDWYAEYYGVNL